MRTTTLGQLTVSAQGLGCMGMSEWYGATDWDESIATIHRALDLGVTFIDTADVYGAGHNEVLVGRCLAGRVVGARQRRCLFEPARESLDVERVDEHAGFGRDELGRPADPRRHDRAAAGHRLEQRLAERLDQRRLADDVRTSEPVWDLAVGDAPRDAHSGAPFEARAKGPVPDEGERAVAERFEGVGEPEHVLPLGERPDAEVRSLAVRRRQQREPLEVDARVDDLRLSPRLRHLRLELTA